MIGEDHRGNEREKSNERYTSFGVCRRATRTERQEEEEREVDSEDCVPLERHDNLHYRRECFLFSSSSAMKMQRGTPSSVTPKKENCEKVNSLSLPYRPKHQPSLTMTRETDDHSHRNDEMKQKRKDHLDKKLHLERSEDGCLRRKKSKQRNLLKKKQQNGRNTKQVSFLKRRDFDRNNNNTPTPYTGRRKCIPLALKGGAWKYERTCEESPYRREASQFLPSCSSSHSTEERFPADFLGEKEKTENLSPPFRKKTTKERTADEEVIHLKDRREEEAEQEEEEIVDDDSDGDVVTLPSSELRSDFSYEGDKEERGEALLEKKKTKREKPRMNDENRSRMKMVLCAAGLPGPFESHRYKEWISLLGEIDEICCRKSRSTVREEEESIKRDKKKKMKEKERMMCSGDDDVRAENDSSLKYFMTEERGRVASLSNRERGLSGSNGEEEEEEAKEESSASLFRKDTCVRRELLATTGREGEGEEGQEREKSQERRRMIIQEGRKYHGQEETMELMNEEKKDRAELEKYHLSLIGGEEEGQREKNQRKERREEERNQTTRSVSLLLDILGKKQSYLVKRQERMLSRVKELEVEIAQGREREKKLERQLASHNHAQEALANALNAANAAEEEQAREAMKARTEAERLETALREQASFFQAQLLLGVANGENRKTLQSPHSHFLGEEGERTMESDEKNRQDRKEKEEDDLELGRKLDYEDIIPIQDDGGKPASTSIRERKIEKYRKILHLLAQDKWRERQKVKLRRHLFQIWYRQMLLSHTSKKRLRGLAEKLLDKEKGKRVQEVALFLGYQLKEELQKKISTSGHKLSAGEKRKEMVVQQPVKKEDKECEEKFRSVDPSNTTTSHSLNENLPLYSVSTASCSTNSPAIDFPQELSSHTVSLRPNFLRNKDEMIPTANPLQEIVSRRSSSSPPVSSIPPSSCSFSLSWWLKREKDSSIMITPSPHTRPDTRLSSSALLSPDPASQPQKIFHLLLTLSTLFSSFKHRVLSFSLHKLRGNPKPSFSKHSSSRQSHSCPESSEDFCKPDNEVCPGEVTPLSKEKGRIETMKSTHHDTDVSRFVKERDVKAERVENRRDNRKNKKENERRMKEDETEEETRGSGNRSRKLPPCCQDDEKDVEKAEIEERKEKKNRERNNMSGNWVGSEDCQVYQRYTLLRKHGAKYIFVSLRRFLRRRSLRPAFHRLLSFLRSSQRRKKEEEQNNKESWRKSRSLSELRDDARGRRVMMTQGQEVVEQERQKISDCRTRRSLDRCRSVKDGITCEFNGKSRHLELVVPGDDKLLSKTLPTVLMCLLLKPLFLKRVQQAFEIWRMKTRFLLPSRTAWLLNFMWRSRLKDTQRSFTHWREFTFLQRQRNLGCRMLRKVVNHYQLRIAWMRLLKNDADRKRQLKTVYTKPGRRLDSILNLIVRSRYEAAFQMLRKNAEQKKMTDKLRQQCLERLVSLARWIRKGALLKAWLRFKNDMVRQ
ncbi:hypothetical protein CSUI_001267 [Cystoisospora suis]|uniref:Uncharacterized protein n=1 Tax=Cystoisospora suis TaxID=483139 RepID=A0A2C6LCY1_9APIC|nr:hypothetical protein CSUI_001267 [Cystoisospora suis]